MTMTMLLTMFLFMLISLDGNTVPVGPATSNTGKSIN